MNTAQQVTYLKEKLKAYPDFPKPGILFRDIFSILGDPEAAAILHNIIKDIVEKQCPDCDVIVGLESRGFLFGTPLSQSISKPFVPVRKKGKLPGNVKKISYSLEYGEDVFEVQEDSIKPGQKVVIIDDLLATGGTMKASCDLVKSLGGEVVLALVCIELSDLRGSSKLSVPFKTIMQF